MQTLKPGDDEAGLQWLDERCCFLRNSEDDGETTAGSSLTTPALFPKKQTPLFGDPRRKRVGPRALRMKDLLLG